MLQELEINLEDEALELKPVFAPKQSPAQPRGGPAPKTRPAAACPRPAPQTVSGFERYSSDTTKLRPRTEQEKIRTSARLIVGSFQPNCEPILSVGVIGHADRDPQRGPEFEKRISRERAQAVRTALEQAIGDPKIVGRINWRVAGNGADLMLTPNPKTEQERARNRRVEIFFGPIPLDGLIKGVTVDVGGASIRFVVQGEPRPGEHSFELYRDQNTPPIPLLPRTEWMRRGAMLGLAQRALAGGQRVRLILANDLVQRIEVYKA